MPDRTFVDTSFVLALINERDQDHETAEALSLEFEESFLITTVAVLLEIGNAMAKDFRAEATGVLRLLRGSRRVAVVEVDQRLLDKALNESAAKSNYVRVIDNEGEDYLYPAEYFMFLDLPQGD